jgi:hypothetical protein
MPPALAAAYVPCRLLNNLLPRDWWSSRKWVEIRSNIRAGGVTGWIKGYALIHAAVESGNEAVLKLLLNKGASVDAIYHGRTALELSFTHQHKSCAQTLLDHGANAKLVIRAELLRDGGRIGRLQNTGTALGVDQLLIFYEMQRKERSKAAWKLRAMFVFCVLGVWLVYYLNTSILKFCSDSGLQALFFIRMVARCYSDRGLQALFFILMVATRLCSCLLLLGIVYIFALAASKWRE